MRNTDAWRTALPLFGIQRAIPQISGVHEREYYQAPNPRNIKISTFARDFISTLNIIRILYF